MDELLQAPEEAPRGLATREIRDVTLRIENPQRAHVLNTLRRPSLKIAAVEGYQLLAGVSSVWQLNQVSGDRFMRYTDRGRLRGAYGPRTHGQLIAAFQKLREDPATRQAYVTLWDGMEHNEYSHDVPCTTGFQFFLRDAYLHLRVTMRSNDAWLGFPIDVMQFSLLHRTMAAALGVVPGHYTHTVGSMHLYEPNYVEALKAVEEGLTQRWGSPLVENGIPAPLPAHGYPNPWIARQKWAEAVVTRPTADVDTIFDTRETWVLDRLPVHPLEYGLCLDCRYVVPLPCNECKDANE